MRLSAFFAHNTCTCTKIIVMRDNILPWTDEKGIQYISIEDFLLDTINKL